MPKALVTGGAGFIGSHLVRALRHRDVDVRVLDNFTSGRRDNLPSDVELIEGDIVDGDLVQQAMSDIDVVFHLAAIASVVESARDWRRAHAVNLGGALEVFHAAARRQGKCRVVFASSAAVYGETLGLPLDEDSPTLPLSHYGADKLAAEFHAHVLAESSGLDWVGFRIFNVYGPGQNPASPYSGVVSIFIDRLRSGKDLRIFGDGNQCRDFVFIDDVVSCLLWAMNPEVPKSNVFNLCTGRGITITELANLLLRLEKGSQKVTYAPPRIGDIQNSVGSNDKLSRFKGPAPRTSLEEALSSLLDTV